MVVILDQTTKALALQFLPVTRNTGVSFGMWQHIDIGFVTMILMLTLVFAHLHFGVPELLIISGGISNFIDRVLRGAVIDWIPGVLFHFNLADVMITFGALWIFLSFLKTKTFSL